MSSINRNDSNKEKKESIFTKETLGVVLILFATLCLICIISHGAIFSIPGEYISWFLLGCFGYFAFPIVIGVIVTGVFLLFDKKLVLSTKQKVLYSAALGVLAILVHTISMHNQASLSYGEYLSTSYLRAQYGLATCSGGGIIVGIVAYVISLLLTNIGSYVILSIALLILGYFIVTDFMQNKGFIKVKGVVASEKFRSSYVSNNGLEESEKVLVEESGNKVVVSEIKEYPVENAVPELQQKTQKLFINNANSFEFKSKKELKNGANDTGIKIEYTNGKMGVSSARSNYQEAYTNELQQKINYIKTPAKIDINPSNNTINTAYTGQTVSDVYGTRISNPIPVNPVEEQKSYQSTTPITPATIPFFEHDDTKEVSNTSNDTIGNATARSNDNLSTSTAEQHARDFSRYLQAEEPTLPKDTYSQPEESYRTFSQANSQDNRVEKRFTYEEQDNLANEMQENLSNESFDRTENIEADKRESQAEEQIQYQAQTQESESYFNEINSNESSVDNVIDDNDFTATNETESKLDEETTFEQSTIEQPAIEQPTFEQPTPPVVKSERARRILFGDTGLNGGGKAVGEEEKPSYTSRVSADRNDRNSSTRNSFDGTRNNFSFTESNSNIDNVKEEVKEEPKKEKKVVPINRKYYRPPLDLLESYSVEVDESQENHEERKEIIKQTLADFHINAEPQGHIQGPSITRYEIMMPPGISVKKVLNYDDDLKMRLSATNGVRIEAPIPGKNLVGIEVANSKKVTVGLKEVLEDMSKTKEKPGSLVFAIGKDLVGEAKCDNLAKGPHYLVAGATGSGKSVALNVMIVSLIMRYSPEELRLILIDPKRVEFRIYEHIPHLMIDEIINEPKKALATLTWAYEEMERRYKMFEGCGGMIVDINAYNENIASATVAKMPRIVIIIDELADLMETCKKDLEAKIRALAQKARSAGIHLVLATQRPSVDIITGTIKANLPSRIALKVMNFNDSQTILGEQGAEKLLGNGDMLFKNSSMPGYERYQGAWISTREINNIVSYIKEHNEAYFNEEFQEYLEKATNPRPDETAMGEDESGGQENSENNDLFIKSVALAINSNNISISQLQRRFQIGYARAGGIIDKMERMGYISGNEGSKARKVFITREQFEEKYGSMPDNEY